MYHSLTLFIGTVIAGQYPFTFRHLLCKRQLVVGQLDLHKFLIAEERVPVHIFCSVQTVLVGRRDAVENPDGICISHIPQAFRAGNIQEICLFSVAPFIQKPLQYGSGPVQRLQICFNILHGNLTVEKVKKPVGIIQPIEIHSTESIFLQRKDLSVPVVPSLGRTHITEQTVIRHIRQPYCKDRLPHINHTRTDFSEQDFLEHIVPIVITYIVTQLPVLLYCLTPHLFGYIGHDFGIQPLQIPQQAFFISGIEDGSLCIEIYGHKPYGIVDETGAD